MSRQDSLLRVFKLNVLENIDKNLILRPLNYACSLCEISVWRVIAHPDYPKFKKRTYQCWLHLSLILRKRQNGVFMLITFA